jgi:UDP-MurNAc hydroxylase
MFKVYYKYSACIKVCTDDIAILCDPWFGGNAYEGTWGQYPPVKDARKLVGNFDAIYISHIHPDHYCAESIAELISFYGPKPIWIADWGNQPDYLAKKIESDGLGQHLKAFSELEIGDTLVNIVPNKTGSLSDIDSALIVASRKTGKAVLNINDCIHNEKFAQSLNRLRGDLDIEYSLFCLGYTGAGPYPQTYYSPITQRNTLLKKAKDKKQQFFERYKKAISSIPSVKRLPFAGKYVLKGDLSMLNQYRGVADALEVKRFDENAIVLDDGGEAYFDLETMKASCEREVEYSLPDQFPNDQDYRWRSAINFIPSDSLLKRLLIKSVKNAHGKSECADNFYWSIYPYENPSDIIDIWSTSSPWESRRPILSFNCNKQLNPFETSSAIPVAHSHMFIEKKALFAVLTGVAHWNNYEVGSVCQVRRVPDQHQPEMQSFLNFCSVI